MSTPEQPRVPTLPEIVLARGTPAASTLLSALQVPDCTCAPYPDRHHDSSEIALLSARAAAHLLPSSPYRQSEPLLTRTELRSLGVAMIEHRAAFWSRLFRFPVVQGERLNALAEACSKRVLFVSPESPQALMKLHARFHTESAMLLNTFESAGSSVHSAERLDVAARLLCYPALPESSLEAAAHVERLYAELQNAHCSTRSDHDRISALEAKLGGTAADVQPIVADMLSHRDKYTALKSYIFEANVRLVTTIDRVVRVPSGRYADCRQDAALGLLKAIERFDFTSDVPFSSFAMFHMRRSVQLGLPHLREVVRVPYPTITALHAMRRELSLPSRTFDAPAAAERLGVSVATAQSLLALAAEPASAATQIRDPRCEEVDNRLLSDERKATLAQALEALPPRLRSAIELKFGLKGDPISERKAAGHLGVCRQRVNQLVQRALELLRASLEPTLG